MKADPFIDALRHGRERFNSLVAAARLSRGGFDEPWFRAHLESTMAPAVRAVAAFAPDRAFPVADALFTLSVRLWERGVLGPTTRFTAVPLGWNLILPGITSLLARDPRQVAAAIANALYRLSAEPEYRPEFWIETIARLGSRCSTVPELLQLGRVIAWRSGMAGLREPALEACEKLPPELAAQALGSDAATLPASRMAGLLEQLRANPWAAPGDPEEREPQVKMAGRVGAFVGFQGRLTAPPRLLGIEPDSQILCLTDRESLWRVVADRFGASWERIRSVPDDLIPAAKTTGAVFGEFRLDRRGAVQWAGAKTDFPMLANWSSCVSCGNVAAVTLPHSHAIHVLARSGPSR